MHFPTLAISYSVSVCLSNAEFLQNKKAAIHILSSVTYSAVTLRVQLLASIEKVMQAAPEKSGIGWWPGDIGWYPRWAGERTEFMGKQILVFAFCSYLT